MRCLAQAAVDAGLVSPPRFTVSTAAGVRTVDYAQGPVPGSATASVDMGPVTMGPELPHQLDGRRARTVAVGNPHLVLLGPDTASVDVAELGPKLQSGYDGGINVEWITVTRDHAGELLDSVSSSAARGRPSPAAPAVSPRPRRRATGAPWDPRARCGCATPAACSTSCSDRATSASSHLAGPVRRWPPSRSTRGCSLERPVARDAHRAHVPGAHHAGRRHVPRPDRRGSRRGARRAGPARRHRRGRRGGTRRAAPRRARPGHLRRPGQGRGDRGSWRAASTPTPSSSTTS